MLLGCKLSDKIDEPETPNQKSSDIFWFGLKNQIKLEIKLD